MQTRIEPFPKDMSAADPIPKIIRTNTFTKKLPDLFAPKKKQKLAIDTAVEARQCNSKESDDRLGSTVDLGYLSPTGDLRRTAFRNSLEYNDNFQTSTRTGTSIAASGTSYGSIDRYLIRDCKCSYAYGTNSYSGYHSPQNGAGALSTAA